ncbi:hypothetical protein GYMLUDRAFT_87170 [Collybiopsis luxurians FD-317 M1]|uniref:Peptidase A1 domain-containing protein n=1 Tax=Collybiopsis luxurians FD-317 M1 TaxID=944289 RepID=A0A0D0CFT0_9AGAR|nr:hypothetical protein GYMLUDRAFT_87170 [Collybiopsis luxurians FD-317 M1]
MGYPTRRHHSLLTRLPAILLLGACATSISSATKIPLNKLHSRGNRYQWKRDDDIGNGSETLNTVLLSNVIDQSYTCNITLGGKSVEVQLDTGSSNLVVPGEIPNSKNLSIPLNVTYAGGNGTGYIETAELEFAGYTIENQAFLNAAVSQLSSGTSGIIGVSIGNASSIRYALNSSAGDTVLDSIFRQNSTDSTNNFITLLLGHSPLEYSNSGSSQPFLENQENVFTIGEVVDGYEQIYSSPKLPIALQTPYETLLDANGVIGPDGKAINTTSLYGNSSQNDQLSVLLDSGTGVTLLPKDVVDSIYGRVPGAQRIVNASDLNPELASLPTLWRLPCTYEVNVSFSFAGQQYPLSPLDTSLNLTGYVGIQDSQDQDICIGGIIEIPPNFINPTKLGAFDAILGDSTLRNIYMLHYFGSFVDGSNSSTPEPYIQLLSTYNATAAHLDFVNTRLGGVDSTGSQPSLLSN